VGWSEAHLCAKCHLDPFSRLATTDMGRKLRGSAPFFGRGAGSSSNTKSPGLRPNSIPSGILIHPAIWLQQIWAENWAGCAPLGRGAGSPSNSVARAEAYLHARFHLDPSNPLTTVHQRHRQDRQRFHSIGRTVLPRDAAMLARSWES